VPDWLGTDDYDVARLLLQRGVAVAYLIAFVNVRNQFRPLLGERGLLPVPAYLERTNSRQAPSLFQWRYSDRIVGAVAWLGIGLSAAVVAGGFDAVPLPIALVGWLMIWGLYLSVVNVGQLFYGFGWESLLLEAGLMVALLGNGRAPTPILAIVMLRWLLFRVEFGAGMIKMRGDECWRDLTCLEYHHETQPMPGPTSRWFHLLPRWAHRVETGANHVVQLVAPWLLFLPQPLAAIGGAAMVVTQAYPMISGNYAWLNFVTLVLALAAIPDSVFQRLGVTVDPASDLASGSTGGWFGVAVIGVACGVAWLSWRPAVNIFSSSQRMNASWNRFHLVNSYGAFGTVTRHRDEVIIEGTADGATWRAYEFKGKPTDPRRRPRQFAPYHLRLDWMMWFVALSPRYGAVWFERLIDRLLLADPAILALLARDPFDGEPPAQVRARIARYRFATRAERRATGDVWIVSQGHVLLGPRHQNSLARRAASP
jgi:hypothetical protein